MTPNPLLFQAARSRIAPAPVTAAEREYRERVAGEATPAAPRPITAAAVPQRRRWLVRRPIGTPQRG